MSNTAITYLVEACAGVFGFTAFCAFILVPAVTSYGKLWERVAAGFLSFYVLAALLGLGVLAGGAVIYVWPRLF